MPVSGMKCFSLLQHHHFFRLEAGVGRALKKLGHQRHDGIHIVAIECLIEPGDGGSGGFGFRILRRSHVGWLLVPT